MFSKQIYSYNATCANASARATRQTRWWNNLPPRRVSSLAVYTFKSKKEREKILMYVRAQPQELYVQVLAAGWNRNGTQTHKHYHAHAHTHAHTAPQILVIGTHTHAYTRTHMLLIVATPYRDWRLWWMTTLATISRLLKVISLFCRISSLLEVSFAKEIYYFKDQSRESAKAGVLHRFSRLI